MARLHEYQGKAILAANGFKIPRGRAVLSADDAVVAAKELGGEVVIKIQAWTTGRAGIGGVAFAKGPDDVRAHAEQMLSMKVGQFPVEAVLFEEKIDIDREFFLSFAIDDAARAPVIIFAAGGGTGIEKRGTFYFAQLATTAPKGSKGLVGFHGAGGGGSMMSMDAVVNAEFTIANFTDTSGNPSASKVYRAARIILAQPDLVGYFGSGSGVASQEQYWSAYGLAKAFWELDLDIPAVIRLGGNTEDRAVDILRRTSELLRAPVEGYRKTDAPAMIAERFAELVDGVGGTKWKPRAPRGPKFVNDPSATTLPVKSGRVWIDTAKWPQICRAVETHSGGLIVDRGGAPVAAPLSGDEFANKDSELLACDVECRLGGVEGFYLELDIPGLDELIGGAR